MKLRIIFMLMAMLFLPKTYAVVDPASITLSAITSAAVVFLFEGAKMAREHFYGDQNELGEFQLAVAKAEQAKAEELIKHEGNYFSCVAANRPGSKRIPAVCAGFAEAFIKAGGKAAYLKVVGNN